MNVLDFIVIWLSVALMVITLIVSKRTNNSSGSSEPQIGATHMATSLRAVSRAAVGLRVLRLMVKLRAAKRFSFRGQMRTVVSQNKRRFRKHGIDLDLSYVTDRVLAMSAPAFGGHTAYRNDIDLVAKLLACRSVPCHLPPCSAATQALHVTPSISV